MRTLNKKATEVLNILTTDLKNPGDHKVFDAHNYTKKWDGGIMATHVENIGFMADYPLFSIAHYYKQNGDMMQDPEMCFLKIGSQFFPCMFQQANMGLYEESIFMKDNTMKYNPRMQKDHALFANMWMKNIKDQQNL